MNVSKELLEKAKTAKTSEELLAIAKAENIELTPEQAAEYFAKINASGELSDEELDNVSGGCGPYKSGDKPIFNIGDRVRYQKVISWVYVGGGSIPRCEDRVSTVVTFTKENGVFRYRLANGDVVPEYELERT